MAAYKTTYSLSTTSEKIYTEIDIINIFVELS